MSKLVSIGLWAIYCILTLGLGAATKGSDDNWLYWAFFGGGAVMLAIYVCEFLKERM